MKNFKLILGLFAVVLVMASCAATQDAMRDDYARDSRTQQVGNRLYVQDPYYGTVVLERDPYTGRYYDVTYGPRYNNMGYYNAYPYRGYRTYRTTPQRGKFDGKIQQPQKPSREQLQQQREGARKKILGN